MLDAVPGLKSEPPPIRDFLLYSLRGDRGSDPVQKLEHIRSPDLVTLALDMDFSFTDDYVTDPDGTISDELTDSEVIKRINEEDVSEGFTLWEFKDNTLIKLADSGYFD